MYPAPLPRSIADYTKALSAAKAKESPNLLVLYSLIREALLRGVEHYTLEGERMFHDYEIIQHLRDDGEVLIVE